MKFIFDYSAHYQQSENIMKQQLDSAFSKINADIFSGAGQKMPIDTDKFDIFCKMIKQFDDAAFINGGVLEVEFFRENRFGKIVYRNKDYYILPRENEITRTALNYAIKYCLTGFIYEEHDEIILEFTVDLQKK